MTGHTSSVIGYRKTGNKEVLGDETSLEKAGTEWCARRQWLARPYYSDVILN